MIGIFLGTIAFIIGISSLYLNIKKIDKLEWQLINHAEFTDKAIEILAKEIDKNKRKKK